jgi:hypothetical protein
MAGSDAALTDRERIFLLALNELGVPFLVVGMSAALLQGARGATEDIDLWFERPDDPRIHEAAHRAGGFWVTRAQPPLLGGMSDRFDVVLSMSGLQPFAEEASAAVHISVDGVPLQLLPLARIIVGKRAANRVKDRAVLPALELALALIDEQE